MKISGRNRLQGRVVEVKRDGLTAEVTLDVAPCRITALITSASADELALAPGDTATALIKATSVMIMK